MISLSTTSLDWVTLMLPDLEASVKGHLISIEQALRQSNLTLTTSCLSSRGYIFYPSLIT